MNKNTDDFPVLRGIRGEAWDYDNFMDKETIENEDQDREAVERDAAAYLLGRY